MSRAEQSVRKRDLAALALFDDTGRAPDVMSRINEGGRRAAGDAFKACNEGAHGKFEGAMVPFGRDAENLAQWIQHL